jgi:predicted  nucleic acid-binding Zn-ribbon protein
LTLDFNPLWKLQGCESAARTLADGLARMPAAVERARGEQAIREAELKSREGEGQDIVLKRRALEKEIADFEAKIQTNATAQGRSKTNVELNAFKAEAAFLREQKSALETRVLELFDAEEAHQSRVREAKDQVARAAAVTAERQKELDERAAGDRAELERRRAECDALASELPPPVRSRFEQVARAKNGVAVVTVQRGACGGCFNALPPQFVNEIRKAEKLMICEGCGRILVWTESASEAGEP